MQETSTNSNNKKRIAFREGRLLFSPTAFQLMADTIAVIMTAVLHILIRFKTGWFGTPVVVYFYDVAVISLFFLVYWGVIYWFAGLFKNWFVRSPFDQFFTIIKVNFFGSFFIFFIWYLASSNTPRLLFLVHFALLSFCVILFRFVFRYIQKKLRIKKIIFIPTLMIGSAGKISEFLMALRKYPSTGYRIDGLVFINEEEKAKWDKNYADMHKNIKFLGFVDNLKAIIKAKKPKDAVFAMSKTDLSEVLRLASVCEENDVTVKIIPGLYDTIKGQVKTLELYNIPLIQISPQLLKPWQQVLKMTIDIVFSFCVLLFGMPIWILIAIAVKMDSKGPVFFKQERVGLNGKIFKIYKFRSMTTDHKNKPSWTAVNDPRVTKVGKFIRKTHLDEIPQFWNILNGDMSIVGPRPEVPYYVEKFSKIIPYYKRRLVVRPGLTGWWQIHYTTYEESADEIKNRLIDDFYYIENMSIKLDLEIIIRTVFLVLKFHGQA